MFVNGLAGTTSLQNAHRDSFVGLLVYFTQLSSCFHRITHHSLNSPPYILHFHLCPSFKTILWRLSQNILSLRRRRVRFAQYFSVTLPSCPFCVHFEIPLPTPYFSILGSRKFYLRMRPMLCKNYAILKLATFHVILQTLCYI